MDLVSRSVEQILTRLRLAEDRESSLASSLYQCPLWVGFCRGRFGWKVDASRLAWLPLRLQ